MTVSDLIAILSQYPADLTVLADCTPITGTEFIDAFKSAPAFLNLEVEC